MKNLTRAQLRRISLRVAGVVVAERPQLRPAFEAAKEYVAFPSDENHVRLRDACRKLEELINSGRECYPIDVVLCASEGVLNCCSYVSGVAVRLGPRAGVPESEIQRFIEEELSK